MTKCETCGIDADACGEWAVRHSLAGNLMQMIGELLTGVAVIGSGQIDRDNLVAYLEDVREAMASACDGVDFVESLKEASAKLQAATERQLAQKDAEETLA